MIDHSSLQIDRFYLVTSTLHSRPITTSKSIDVDEDFIVQYVLQLFDYRGPHKRVAVIKGNVHGLSRNVDLTRFTGFRITHYADPPNASIKDTEFLKSHGLPSSFSIFSIEEGAIDSIRLLEKKDGPLILNWFYLSEELKAHLFQ